MMVCLSGYSKIHPLPQVWKIQWHHLIYGIFHLGWGLIMVSYYSFFQVTGIKTRADDAIRLSMVGEWRGPLSMFSNWCYKSLIFHVLEGFSYLFSGFYWDFPVGILHWGYWGSKHMVYAAGLFSVMSKEVGKVCFNAIISLMSAVVRWSWEGATLCTILSWNEATHCIQSLKWLLNGPGKGQPMMAGPDKGFWWQVLDFGGYCCAAFVGCLLGVYWM